MTNYRANKGTTLIELTITLAILAIIGGLAVSMFVNINNIQIKAVVRKEVQEEMRSLMEKIVQDVRNHSLDYRGYYVKNGPYGSLGEGNRDDSNLSYIGIPTAFPTGGDILNPAPDFIPTKNEQILLLLSSDGKERIKYKTYDFDGDTKNDTLMMSKQVYSDTGACQSFPETEINYPSSHNWNSLLPAGDSFCWVLDNGFGNTADPFYGYLPISNPNINITDLQFYFQVQKNPFKVYEEDAVQLQPMVTIKMTGSYNIGDEVIVGGTPEMILQTTVSARYYEETEWSTL